MTHPKPLHAGLLKRDGLKAAAADRAGPKTRRKVGVRLDLDRYVAFKAFCARAGLTGEQALELALDRLLASGGTEP